MTGTIMELLTKKILLSYLRLLSNFQRCNKIWRSLWKTIKLTPHWAKKAGRGSLGRGTVVSSLRDLWPTPISRISALTNSTNSTLSKKEQRKTSTNRKNSINKPFLHSNRPKKSFSRRKYPIQHQYHWVGLIFSSPSRTLGLKYFTIC